MGLSISKRFAEALGGEITVTSKPGKGTVFTVRIETGPLEGVPMLDDSTARAHFEEIRRPTTDLTNIQLNKASVLLVDDGESNREFISVVLQQLGLQVTEAENGQQAVDAALTNDFDLILMDMQMPVMDGYSATRTLRGHGFTIPIIALTANAMQSDEKKCEAAGCDGFLAKPVDLDKLTELLRQRLGDGLSNPPVSIETKNDEIQNVERGGPILSTLPPDPIYRPIVSKFIARLPERLEAMCDAWDERNYSELTELAHWLKGAAGTVGFGIFTEPAMRLQQLAEAGQESEVEAVLELIIDMAGRLELQMPIGEPTEPALSGEPT